MIFFFPARQPSPPEFLIPSRTRISFSMATKATKTNRCWPGYTPVPGKKQHEQGSCRPKAKSKMSSGEKTFRKKRKTQLDRWHKSHTGTRRSAAQHLHKPAAKKRTALSSRRKRAAA